MAFGHFLEQGINGRDFVLYSVSFEVWLYEMVIITSLFAHPTTEAWIICWYMVQFNIHEA